MRSLIALALLAAGPALAFDRERLASETPMELCPAQGAGFARIPGTSTCIRISGRVAAGADLGRADRAPGTPPNAARLQIDARSPSAYGDVRSVLRIGAGR